MYLHMFLRCLYIFQISSHLTIPFVGFINSKETHMKFFHIQIPGFLTKLLQSLFIGSDITEQSLVVIISNCVS